MNDRLKKRAVLWLSAAILIASGTAVWLLNRNPGADRGKIQTASAEDRMQTTPPGDHARRGADAARLDSEKKKPAAGKSADSRGGIVLKPLMRRANAGSGDDAAETVKAAKQSRTASAQPQDDRPQRETSAAQPQSNPTPESRLNSQMQPETQPETKSETRPETKPETRPETQPDERSESEGKPDSEQTVEFETVADYARANIVRVRKTADHNLDAIRTRVYETLATDEQRSRVYFLEREDSVLIIDLNDKLLGSRQAGGSDAFENKIYFSPKDGDNRLEEADETELQRRAEDREVLLISGEHRRSHFVTAHYVLGLPGNRYNGPVAAFDEVREVAGINFISDQSEVREGANGAMLTVKSKAQTFDLTVDHNSFRFGRDDAQTQLYRGIGIYSVVGRLNILNNRFEGQNKKNGAGSPNIHGMIDCQNRIGRKKADRDKTSLITVEGNTFKDVYSADILLYASEREAVHIEDNVFDGSGEEAIKISPVIAQYPAEHDLIIRGNVIKNYGRNENTGYTDGGYGPLGPVNEGEFGVHLNYYDGIQRGSKVNGVWASSADQLATMIKADNTISPKAENDANSGVVDSQPVRIGQKDSYLNTGEKINDSTSYHIKNASLVIVKNDHGDITYGQDPNAQTAEITVKHLYITGTGTGVVTLPSTLRITGDLKVDLPNGSLKLEASVTGRQEINASRTKNSAVFEVLTKDPVYRGSATEPFRIQISALKNDAGETLSAPDLDFEIFLGKTKLPEARYSYRDGILSIDTEALNALTRSEKLLVRIRSASSGMSEVSSPLILIETVNLSAGEFKLSGSKFSHMDAEQEIAVRITGLKNNRGQLVDPARTKLSGNVTFRLSGVAMASDLISVDDATDTVTLTKPLLNQLYATRYEAGEERNANFGMHHTYELEINDPSNHIYDAKKTLAFEVIDRSGADFVFEDGMTFTQGEAPEKGITLSVKNVTNTRGNRLDPSQTQLKDGRGQLNMNVEPFPVQRDDTPDSELLVLRDEKGQYIREYFNPKYVIVDDEKDTITFTKAYLDRIEPGKEASTEGGIKTFVFNYTDAQAHVDVRSQKVSLHIKLKEKALSRNTEISFRRDTFKISGQNIAADGANVEDLMVSGFLQDVIRHNPRQQVLVMREDRVLRSFERIRRGDTVKIIAEDGETTVLYTLAMDPQKRPQLITAVDQALIAEMGDAFIMVNSTAHPSIDRCLKALTLADGVSAKVVRVRDDGKAEYEPAKDSTLTADMTLVLTLMGKDYRFDIRCADGAHYRALLIGNQDYGSEKMNLKGPENDLRMMQALFTRASFDGARMSTINVQRNLRKTEFLEQLEKTFAGATDEDVSYLYYSGHGFNLKSNHSSYLCTVDALPEASTAEASAQHWISVDELKAALDKVPGKKVVILDCCNAGGFIGKSFVDGVTRPTPNFRPTDASEEFVADVRSTFETSNPNLHYLTDPEYKVLVASSANEYSYEDKKTARGKFTVELANGAGYRNGKQPADADRNGEVSLAELYRYTMDNVASISHIQVFPQRDSFPLFKQVDAQTLNSSLAFSIKANAYRFSSRTDSKGRLIGMLSSGAVEIHDGMSAQAFLSNVDPGYAGQTLELVHADGRRYEADERLRRTDAYLKVTAEDGTTSRFSIMLSSAAAKSVMLKGDAAKGIVVKSDPGSDLYAIDLSRHFTTVRLIQELKLLNLRSGFTYAFFDKTGKPKPTAMTIAVSDKDVLEVTTADGKISKRYNITVSAGEAKQIEGRFKVAGNTIGSGEQPLTREITVGELIKWLSENGFNFKDNPRMSGVYRANAHPPFGMPKREAEKLASGDRVILVDFEGRMTGTYSIAFAGEETSDEPTLPHKPGNPLHPPISDEEPFDDLEPDFGDKLIIQGDRIKSGTMRLTAETTMDEINAALVNLNELGPRVLTAKSGVFKQSVQVVGKLPKGMPKKPGEKLEHGDRLILVDKAFKGETKVYTFELDEPTGTMPSVPPIIIDGPEDTTPAIPPIIIEAPED